MCTVTLEYNQRNALARRKLAELLATGLFLQKQVQQENPADEEAEIRGRGADIIGTDFLWEKN